MVPALSLGKKKVWPRINGLAFQAEAGKSSLSALEL